MAEAEAGLELPIGLTEQKFLQQLARIEARAIKSAQRSEKAFVQGNAQIGKSFGTMSGQARAGLQNVSYQLQDIFVQIQGGQGAARALSQQLPQLLSGFGLVGSAIGLVAAAGIPLAASFFSSGEEAKKLDDVMKELTTSLADYEAAVGNATTPTDDLVEKYGRAAGAAQLLLQQMAQLAKLDAASALRASASAVSDSLSGAVDALNRFEAAQKSLAPEDFLNEGTAAAAAMQAQVDKLRDEFGLTVDQATRLRSILTDQSTASTPEQVADAMRRLSSFLADANEQSNYLLDNMLANERQAAQGALAGYEFAAALESAEAAASGVVGTVDQLPGAIDAATASALALTRALSAAIAASQAVPGTIGAPSLDRFGNGEDITRRAGGMDLQDQQTFRYDWQEQLKAEEEARRKAEQAAGRKGRGGGKGRKEKKETTSTDIFENAGRDLKQLERQLMLVGKNTEETARYRAEWEMVDALQKAGIPITAKLNQSIQEQAAAYGYAAVQLEQAEQSYEQFESTIEGIASAFSEALIEGESLREGLAGVLKGIASDIVTSGIRNALMQQFSGAGGGGGIFGAIGSFFGGAKLPSFNGGGFTGYGSRSGGIDGLGGMPAIVHPNETVIDHTKGQQAGGGAVDVRVFMDEGGNWQAKVEQISGRVSARTFAGASKAQRDGQYLRNGRN